MKHIAGVALALALVCPTIVGAHSMGASLERAVNGYFIDIGYDPPDLTAGDRMVFDFNISSDPARERIEFDSVWVRIADVTGNDAKTLFATGVGYAEIGATTLLFQLPDDIEELSLAVRFEKEGTVLANADFSIPVAPAKQAFNWPLAGAIGGVALAGAFLFVLLRVVRRKEEFSSPVSLS